jgi:hypothetical protein
MAGDGRPPSPRRSSLLLASSRSLPSLATSRGMRHRMTQCRGSSFREQTPRAGAEPGWSGPTPAPAPGQGPCLSNRARAPPFASCAVASPRTTSKSVSGAADTQQRPRWSWRPQQPSTVTAVAATMRGCPSSPLWRPGPGPDSQRRRRRCRRHRRDCPNLLCPILRLDARGGPDPPRAPRLRGRRGRRRCDCRLQVPRGARPRQRRRQPARGLRGTPSAPGLPQAPSRLHHVERSVRAARQRSRAVAAAAASGVCRDTLISPLLEAAAASPRAALLPATLLFPADGLGFHWRGPWDLSAFSLVEGRHVRPAPHPPRRTVPHTAGATHFLLPFFTTAANAPHTAAVVFPLSADPTMPARVLEHVSAFLLDGNAAEGGPAATPSSSSRLLLLPAPVRVIATLALLLAWAAANADPLRPSPQVHGGEDGEAASSSSLSSSSPAPLQTRTSEAAASSASSATSRMQCPSRTRRTGRSSTRGAPSPCSSPPRLSRTGSAT